mgnify:CR=1 FL=1
MVKYVYTLGASGERVKVEELDRTVEYSYDELYRLTSETITKGKTKTTYTYAYDSVSNRTLKTVNGVETVYTYNELNQLVSENNTTYEYDNAGNLVRVVGAGKTALYVYNADNKLVKATVQQGSNVVVETYTYDYAGNRTSKTTSTNNHVEKVYYLNDNSSLTNVLAEYSANGDEICWFRKSSRVNAIITKILTILILNTNKTIGKKSAPKFNINLFSTATRLSA